MLRAFTHSFFSDEAIPGSRTRGVTRCKRAHEGYEQSGLILGIVERRRQQDTSKGPSGSLSQVRRFDHTWQ